MGYYWLVLIVWMVGVGNAVGIRQYKEWCLIWLVHRVMAVKGWRQLFWSQG